MLAVTRYGAANLAVLLSPDDGRPAHQISFGARRRLDPSLAGIGALIVIGFGFGALAPPYYLFVVNTAILAAIGAVALQLLLGYAGQVSIGNAAFMALGAWTAAVLGPTIGFLPSIGAGGAVGALIGLLIGLPALRLAHLYLALSTLALQFIVEFAFNRYETATNHSAGFQLPAASLGPLDLSSDQSWFVLLVLVLALIMLLSWFMLEAKPGRAWVAIREHNVAAAIIGVDVTRYKLLAFTVSSFYIGVQGALFAYYTRVTSAELFTLDSSIAYAVMVLIGGLGSLPGAILGAFIVTLLPLAVNAVGNHMLADSQLGTFVTKNLPFLNQLVYGLLVLAFLYFEPRGIAGLLRRYALGRTGSRQAEARSVA